MYQSAAMYNFLPKAVGSSFAENNILFTSLKV